MANGKWPVWMLIAAEHVLGTKGKSMNVQHLDSDGLDCLGESAKVHGVTWALKFRSSAGRLQSTMERGA